MRSKSVYNWYTIGIILLEKEANTWANFNFPNPTRTSLTTDCSGVLIGKGP